MEFTYKHDFNSLPLPIKYGNQLFSIGSCFAENIGQQLLAHKFQVILNPSGILFNPISIAKSISFYLDPKAFNEQEQIFQFQDLFHSWMHHGKYSNPNENELKENIKAGLKLANEKLLAADYLLITWGSAFVYELKDSKKIVANCHKVPNSNFHKRLLTTAEIVETFTKLIRELLSVKPNLQIIWSISPVKYLKDGLHQNNLSKSTLLLALDELLHQFPHQYYFPAFELVQDELRDYRFYAEDFAHPNSLAIQYIWEKFRESCIDKNAQITLSKIAEINQAMAHRPLHVNTKAYHDFRKQQFEKIASMKLSNPEINLEKELVFFTTGNESTNFNS